MKSRVDIMKHLIIMRQQLVVLIHGQSQVANVALGL